MKTTTALLITFFFFLAPLTLGAQSTTTNVVFIKGEAEETSIFEAHKIDLALTSDTNMFYHYRINAPADMNVRISSQAFSTLVNEAEITDLMLVIKDVTTGEEVARIQPEAFETTAFYQKVIFSLSDFTIPRGESYDFFVRGRVVEAGKHAFVSFTKGGFGAAVKMAFDAIN